MLLSDLQTGRMLWSTVGLRGATGKMKTRTDHRNTPSAILPFQDAAKPSLWLIVKAGKHLNIFGSTPISAPIILHPDHCRRSCHWSAGGRKPETLSPPKHV